MFEFSMESGGDLCTHQREALILHLAVTDLCCPICYVANESLLHVLIGCPFAQEVWSKTGIGVHGLEA